MKHQIRCFQVAFIDDWAVTISQNRIGQKQNQLFSECYHQLYRARVPCKDKCAKLHLTITHCLEKKPVKRSRNSLLSKVTRLKHFMDAISIFAWKSGALNQVHCYLVELV